MLLNLAAEVLLVQQSSADGFDTVLQLQQREFGRHQFKNHGAVFDFGAQAGQGGRQYATVIVAHGLPREREVEVCLRLGGFHYQTAFIQHFIAL
ncbi:Uncharacterised protein [Neisseria meningitidis]|nr:Uncharacterised protein [Neisseria meningitidis]